MAAVGGGYLYLQILCSWTKIGDQELPRVAPILMVCCVCIFLVLPNIFHVPESNIGSMLDTIRYSSHRNSHP